MQNNSISILVIDMLAELPTILDSFFTSTSSDYIGVVGREWWGATNWWRKHTLCNYSCIMDPLVHEMASQISR